jgi:signal transduction histidine kinase
VDDAGFTPAPAIGTAVYRVVQESLTNVLRHSRARTVRVEVAAGREAALLLEVCDPGPARPHGTEGSGVGIRGMSERVIATGGRLEAGPAADGGFEVRARWDDARSRGRAR